MNNFSRHAFERTAGASLRLGVAALVLACLSTQANADSMQEVVLRALQVDPLLAEASANLRTAEAQTESARRQHWPRLGVAGSESLDQRSRDLFDEDDVRLYSTINVWSGGGIEAAVRSGKESEAYFRSLSDQSREDVAYRAASLYLEGLRAEEERVLAGTNLMRLDSLKRDLGVVASLDTGRRSDLTQASSRQAQARARVVTAETAVGVVQSRLLRYGSGQPVEFEPVLIDAPELRETPKTVIERQPEYLAQVADVKRLEERISVVKARRWPTLDAEGAIAGENDARLLLNWNLADGSTWADVTAAEQELEASKSRLRSVETDLRERFETVRVNYEQAIRKQEVAEEQIGIAEQVVGAFEEQFQIARRSMIDLLNAYSELATVELSASQSRAEYRLAALQYLRALGRTENWANTTAARTPSATPLRASAITPRSPVPAAATPSSPEEPATLPTLPSEAASGSVPAPAPDSLAP